jgi:hypothetical protein
MNSSLGRPAPAVDYARFAAVAAVLAGACGLLYSAAFVVASRSPSATAGGLAAGLLMAGALLGAAALIGLHQRVAPVGAGFATAALALGLGGAAAAALHGGYDLANVLHPPGAIAAGPSQVDPRGLGTFGLAGLSLLVFARLMAGGAGWPRGLAGLGFLSGALLVVVYLARLIVLDASSPLVLGPAALEGFVVNPAWYAWLGLALRGSASPSSRIRR